MFAAVDEMDQRCHPELSPRQSVPGYGRFDNARLLRVYSFCADPCSSQARIKVAWKERSSSGRVITGRWLVQRSDVQCVSGSGFPNAFAGRFRIGYRVARTAVQRPWLRPVAPVAMSWRSTKITAARAGHSRGQSRLPLRRRQYNHVT